MIILWGLIILIIYDIKAERSKFILRLIFCMQLSEFTSKPWVVNLLFLSKLRMQIDDYAIKAPL